jgi:hypothetical protein
MSAIDSGQTLFAILFQNFWGIAVTPRKNGDFAEPVWLARIVPAQETGRS